MLKILLTLSLLSTGCSVLNKVEDVCCKVKTLVVIPVNEPTLVSYDTNKTVTNTIESELLEAMSNINTSKEVNELDKGDDYVLVPEVNNEIINIISYAEVADKDTVYGDNIRKGRYLPTGHKPVSKTPIKEIPKLQREMLEKGSKNTPVGLCQFNIATIMYLKDSEGLPNRELFDEPTQRLLCSSYLEKHVKISDWLNNKITTDQFINRLALKWASLPDTTGSSHYDQRTGIKLCTLRRKLRELKRNYKNTYVRVFSC